MFPKIVGLTKKKCSHRVNGASVAAAAPARFISSSHSVHTHTPPPASTTPAAAATHVGDLGVGALHVVGVLGARLAGRAQLLVHAGLVLGTPDAAVLLAGVLAEAAVLPAHRAVVQRDCGDNQSVSSSAFCPLQSIDRSIDRSLLDEHVAQQLSHSRPTGGSAQINCCSVVFSLTLAVGAVTLDS